MTDSLELFQDRHELPEDGIGVRPKPTLPYSHYCPSLLLKGFAVLLVSGNRASELGLPVLRVALRHMGAALAAPVPEAAVNEDR